MMTHPGPHGGPRARPHGVAARAPGAVSHGERLAQCPAHSKCSTNGCYFFVTKGRFFRRGRGLQTPPCVPALTQQQAGKLPSSCPAPPSPLPPLQSQSSWGSTRAAAEECTLPAPSPRPPLPPHLPIRPHGRPPAQGAWPRSSPTAHAGLTHARPAARPAGPCAAMAWCPLPGTARPVHSLADGSRVGARRGVRAPAGA